MNDLLDIELVNDSLKKFDSSWEETLTALEKRPEASLLAGHHRRQVETSTLMQTAWRHGIPIRFTAKSRRATRGLKAMVSDVVEDQQQHYFLVAQKEKGWVNDRAIPVATVKKRRRQKKRDCTANSGHRKAHAQVAENVRSRKMTKIKEREKDKRQRAPRPTTSQPSPKSEVSNQTGTSSSGKRRSMSLFLQQERQVSERQDLRLLANSVLRLSQRHGQCRSGAIGPFVHIGKDGRGVTREQTNQTQMNRTCSRRAKQEKTFCKVPTVNKLHSQGNGKRRKAAGP